MADRQFILPDVTKLISEKFETVGRTEGVRFSRVAPIFEADGDCFSFVASERRDKERLVSASRAGVLMCDRDVPIPMENLETQCFIRVERPRETFARVANILFKREQRWGVHATATIHEEARIAEDVHIGPNTVVGRCTIGAGTIVHGNCFLFDGVTIGANVDIGPGCTIGAVGFGYMRSKGEIFNFPHLGGVHIEDDVHIGACTCVDRGALGNTVLKKGCKIDNLVHVAHNVIVGEGAFVIAHAMVAGSTKIGRNAWIAPNAALRDQLVIGEDAIIGLGSVVVKNVPAGEVWMGVPARRKD